MVCGTEALTGIGHQVLVALPFGEAHPEAEPAFLVFRDSPKARRRAVVPCCSSAHPMPATQ